LAELAFGHRPPEGHSGLYSVSYRLQTITPPVGGSFFGLMTILLGDDRVIAGIFTINGFLFMLWLPPDLEPHKISGPHVYGKDWDGLTFTRHIVNLDFNISSRLRMRSHRVRFNWV
jgi:hypothetical protein